MQIVDNQNKANHQKTVANDCPTYLTVNLTTYLGYVTKMSIFNRDYSQVVLDIEGSLGMRGRGKGGTFINFRLSVIISI